MINCIILCRVSTPRQTQGESLDTQEQIGRHIAANNNWNVVRVWREPYSARKDDRPTINEILAYVRSSRKTNPVHKFIFRDIDRFTRAGAVLYRQLKETFATEGVDLVDSYGLIQPTINTLQHLGIEYSWSRYSPSEMAETMKADLSKDEVRTILTRIIGTEIQLRRQGYQIANPLDGFVNQKIIVDGKKRVIQAANPERARFYVAMYELRASGRWSDPEIVAKLNAMGYRTLERQHWDKSHTRVIGVRGGKPLTVKQLHQSIRHTEYCGVICEKWTSHQPIRAKYPGLVSIDTFNRANRGKVYIKESVDGNLQILYNYLPERIVRAYRREHPLFPFKFLRCHLCGSPLKASCPRGKSGRCFPTYHCARGHEYWGVSKAVLEAAVAAYVERLRAVRDFAPHFEHLVFERYHERQQEAAAVAASVRRTIEDLKAEKQQAVAAFVEARGAVMRQELEQRIEKLEHELKGIDGPSGEEQVTEAEVRRFLDFASTTIEHPEEMLLVSENPTRQRALFGAVFEEVPTYVELKNGTPKLGLTFELSEMYKRDKSFAVHNKRLRWNTIVEEIRRWLDVFANDPSLCLGLPSDRQPMQLL